MGNLEFLDGDTPADVVVASEAAPEPAPSAEAAPEGPVRGPDGRFAPKAETPAPAAPEVAPQPVAAAPPPAPEPVIPPGYVPVSVVQGLRDEIRSLRTPPQAPQPRHEPPPAPDMFEDPDGYREWQQGQISDARWNAVTTISQELAEDKFGADRVREATDAFLQEAQQRPSLIDEMRQQRHPYAWVVQRHEQQRLTSQINPDRYQAFLAWEAAQQQAAQAAPAAPAAPPQSEPPPRSMAALPNAGGSKPGEHPVGPGVSFDALFTR